VSYGYNPPPWTGNLNVWASNVITYLQRVASRLAYRTADARATENGVILYDNVNGYPVIAKDGEWRQVVLADGYAFFGQDNDITAAATNTAYAITYDTPPMANGISLGSPASRIVFAEGGTYLLSFSAQITSTSGSTVGFRFWPRINGVDVPGSTMVANLHQSNATLVISRTAIFQVSAGDYLEAMWAVDRSSGYLHATAATAYAPAAPSTSLSVTRIRA
jgi:hypothetical protein